MAQISLFALNIGYNAGSIIIDDITTFDFGLTATLSYELKNGLYFNMRYQRGLANLFPMSSFASIKVEGISINAGYYFSRLPSIKRHHHTPKPAKEHKSHKHYPSVDE